MDEEFAKFELQSATLTDEQKTHFNRMQKTLKLLEKAKLSAENAPKLKLGNCGESTYYSLYELLKEDTHHQLKLQIVRVARKNANDNHTFLLINSNKDDIEIADDANAVKKYLQTLPQGQYCDSWNNGFLMEVNKNQNDYYRQGWHHLNVETVSLDYDRIILPNEVNSFINSQFIRLGLPINHVSSPENDEVLTKESWTFRSV